MELVKIPYDPDKIRLNKIYEDKEQPEQNQPFTSSKIMDVYGPLYIGEITKDRPYTFTSLVTSIDGRIAFNDAPEGPFIAQKNKLDQDGASCDFWILNMLRSYSDGIIIGANTLRSEPDFTGHIFDQDLEDARVEAGYQKIPWNIITSKDGSDIPFDHVVFKHEEIPVVFNTSSKGLEIIRKNYKSEIAIIYEAKEITLDPGKTYVVVTGDKEPDTKKSLKILRKIGIERLLVESPTIAHIYIQEQVMDELFLNYSCIYLGGNSLSIGATGEAFTSENKPHTRMLSIHSHSSHFFYFRHKLIYN